MSEEIKTLSDTVIQDLKKDTLSRILHFRGQKMIVHIFL